MDLHWLDFAAGFTAGAAVAAGLAVMTLRPELARLRLELREQRRTLFAFLRKQNETCRYLKRITEDLEHEQYAPTLPHPAVQQPAAPQAVPRVCGADGIACRDCE